MVDPAAGDRKHRAHIRWLAALKLPKRRAAPLASTHGCPTWAGLPCTGLLVVHVRLCKLLVQLRVWQVVPGGHVANSKVGNCAHAQAAGDR